MTPEQLTARLREGVLLLDGATGTMLQRAGLPPGGAPERWNLERPEVVAQVHRSYVEAGSQLFLTNTLGANPITLGRHGLADQVTEINHAAVRIAREVAGDSVLVGASIGPIGELLAPLGSLEPEAAEAAFTEHAQAVAEAGADAIFVETFLDLEEARAAVRVAARTGLAVVASLAFQPSGRTVMGVPPEALVELLAAGACVVGANCGSVTPAEMIPILQALHARTDAPLIAKPNAGRPELREGKTVFGGTPDQLADASEQFSQLGVRMIGGCCGTTPECIRALAARLN